MPNTYPFSDPVAISKLAAQALGVEMLDLRRGLGALSQPMHGNTFGTTSGVFPGGTSGAGPSNDLACGSISGLACQFNAGHFASDRGAGNLYLSMAYSGWSVNLDDGDAVNPRCDIVALRTRDPGVDGAAITESAFPVVHKGTAAATPAKPTGLLQTGDVPLWSFIVGAGSQYRTVISNADERLFLASRGGIVLRRAIDPRPGAYEGQTAYNLDTKAIEVWTGTEWMAVAGVAAWKPFAPKLYSSGAGECSLGSQGRAVGSYQLLGKTLRVRYYFIAAGSGINMGYGDVTTRLPAGLFAASADGGIAAGSGRCQLNTQPAGQSYLEWMGVAGIFAGSNVVYPKFNKTITDNTYAPYRVASSQGQAGTGVPLLANSVPDPLRGMSIDMELEVA